jgi:chromosome segregation ATPase
LTVIESRSHVTQMQEMQQIARDLLAHVERLTMIVSRLAEEKRHLADEVDFLRHELAKHESGEPASFDERDDLEEAHRRLAGRYGVLEQEMRSVVTLESQ